MPGKSKKEVAELNKQPEAKEVKPSTEEEGVRSHISKRVQAMKAWRTSLKIEEEWKDADAEYLPRPLNETGARKRFETDQDSGLRSRLVPINSKDEWRSANSDPMLLVKIQTALSIIIDRNPGAVFSAMSKKYEGTTAVAKAAWKRTWKLTNAKNVMKLFCFDQIKYGTAFGRTFPRRVEYDKKILTKYYPEDTTKNEYQAKKLLMYNDLARERLNPFRTWIDEMTQPYDQFSMNDNYFEVDYGYDQAKVEFGMYDAFKGVKPMEAVTTDTNSTEQLDEDKNKMNTVTLGFYESRSKDLFGIIVPRQENLLLTYSPLPNDDGMLSVWHTPWILRNASSPYGVSLWRIIKQDKELYDKMKNMTMDQLVLSIMKMFFYTGSSNLLGDGNIKITPGLGKQIINGKIDWLEVPGPGADSWKGLDALQGKIDTNSGVTPTLEGDTSTSKTLGEILHAKESALKRMRLPLENIGWAIEQDAYISISWFPQLYSTPEVMKFASPEDLKKYQEENGVEAAQSFQKLDEMGNQEGDLEATFMPELKLGLEKQGDTFIESKKDRFFTVGKDLPLDTLRWRGVIEVVPKSIISSSTELDKQKKLEIFNLLAPLLLNPPELFAKSAKQILLANDSEEPEDWLPESWVEYLKELETGKKSLFISNQPAMNGGMPITSGGQSMQGATNIKPNQGAPTIIPRAQTANINIPGITSNVSNNMGSTKL